MRAFSFLIARPQWLVFGGFKETLFIFYSFIQHREGQTALFRNKISLEKVRTQLFLVIYSVDNVFMIQVVNKTNTETAK